MKRIRALVGLAVLVAAVYVMWNLVPPYFHNYEFQDVVADEARTNTYTNKSEDQMKDTIFQKAREMNIPLTREQISVQRGGNTVAIEVHYTVHLEFPIHPIDLNFQTSSANRGY